VHEYLRESLRVAVDRRQLFRDGDLECLPTLREKRPDQRSRVLHDGDEVDALTSDAELPGLDAHAFQQIVDELRETQRASLQREYEFSLLFRPHRGEPLAQQLDRGELRGERSA